MTPGDGGVGWGPAIGPLLHQSRAKLLSAPWHGCLPQLLLLVLGEALLLPFLVYFFFFCCSSRPAHTCSLHVF